MGQAAVMGFAPVEEVVTACPICGKPLRDTDRVERRRVPVTVPEGHEREHLYEITERYTLAECENEHTFACSGGKGPMGWRTMTGAV